MRARHTSLPFTPLILHAQNVRHEKWNALDQRLRFFGYTWNAHSTTNTDCWMKRIVQTCRCVVRWVWTMTRRSWVQCVMCMLCEIVVEVDVVRVRRVRAHIAANVVLNEPTMPEKTTNRQSRKILTRCNWTLRKQYAPNSLYAGVAGVRGNDNSTSECTVTNHRFPIYRFQSQTKQKIP